MSGQNDDFMLSDEYFAWCMAEHDRQIHQCPQCGSFTPELHEGYCHPCLARNQAELDRHNAEFDRWEKLTPDQREAEIKWASR